MELLLAEEELIALTEAKTRPAQMAWLDARGFHYEVGAKGGSRCSARTWKARWADATKGQHSSALT
jgi:Domain of unknown function (DUF4224)